MSKELREQFAIEIKETFTLPSYDENQKRYIDWLESKLKEADEKKKEQSILFAKFIGDNFILGLPLDYEYAWNKFLNHQTNE